MNLHQNFNPEPVNLRNVIIIRGCSSSGKSSFANLLQTLYPSAEICCADDWFYVDGKYNFSFSKLGYVHKMCLDKFKNCVDNKKKLIIVANTNTTPKEWGPYEKYAKDSNYRVTFIVLEKRHEGTNDHSVPSEIIKNQESRILKNIKLT